MKIAIIILLTACASASAITDIQPSLQQLLPKTFTSINSGNQRIFTAQQSHQQQKEYASINLYFENDARCTRPATTEPITLDRCIEGLYGDYAIWKCKGRNLELYNCDYDSQCARKCKVQYSLLPAMSGECWWDEDLNIPFSIEFKC